MLQDTRIENILYKKFFKHHKIRVPEGCGVLTATDEYMFPGFQFLYFSITLSHEVPICVIDIGMSKLQRDWCEERGIMVHDLVYPRPMPDPTTWGYHAWNKPAYALQTPFQRTLWLDADTVVFGGLDIFFNMIDEEPLFTSDHFGVRTEMLNASELYQRMSILPRQRATVYLNSGVYAFDKDRDKPLLELWYSCVHLASTEPKIRSYIKWWDQGALLWTLEKMGKTHLVRSEKCFNSPAKRVGTPWGKEGEASVENFLVDQDNPDGCIVRHFQSHPKPWHSWPRGAVPIRPEKNLSSRLKIFVLAHSWDGLAQVGDRPYFQKVNLAALPLGEFQTNQLAESRIFMSKLVEECNHEYIGFASVRWNDKYEGLGTTKLEDIHQAELLLKPNNVIVAMRTDNGLGPLGVLDTKNWHTHMEYGNRGISKYLAELERVSGISNCNVSFFANNFICHRDVFKEFLEHWRKVFMYFYKRYSHGMEYTPADPKRLAAYLYEAITINYFSSRTDLNIIEAKKTQAFKPF
jgi:hypothetical protein